MDHAELAKRLREQKSVIERMAYALKLTMPGSVGFIEADAHCVCSWIDDACDALSSPTRATARQ
jgi:hypothetical protein